MARTLSRLGMRKHDFHLVEIDSNRTLCGLYVDGLWLTGDSMAATCGGCLVEAAEGGEFE